MSVGLNRASGFYYSNLIDLKYYEVGKNIKEIDDVYLIDSLGNIPSQT